jgi:hypothetical protein
VLHKVDGVIRGNEIGNAGIFLFLSFFDQFLFCGFRHLNILNFYTENNKYKLIGDDLITNKHLLDAEIDFRNPGEHLIGQHVLILGFLGR